MRIIKRLLGIIILFMLFISLATGFYYLAYKEDGFLEALCCGTIVVSSLILILLLIGLAVALINDEI